MLSSGPRKSRDSSERDNDQKKTSLRRTSFLDPPRWRISLINENGTGESRRLSIDVNRNVSTCKKIGDKMDEEEEEEESENRNMQSYYASSNQAEEMTAREILMERHPSSPEPFQSLQSFSQSLPTPVRNEYCTNISVQSNCHMLPTSLNTSSFGSDRTKKSPLLSSNTGRDSLYLSKTLQNGINPNFLPFAPKTQLIRRLDRPPGGLFLDTSVLENLGEPTTPLSWHCRRNLSRDKMEWRNNKSDFSLPNVPGASNSPLKNSKKKLNAISPNPADMYLSPGLGGSTRCCSCTSTNLVDRKRKRIFEELPVVDD